MKLTNYFFKFTAFLLLITIVSCKPAADLNYMKDIDQLATNASVANASATIQPGDQLGIWVTAEDMDAAAPFNQNFARIESAPTTTPSGNTSSSAANGQLPTYTVKTDQSISFPVIGRISTEGLTVEQLTSDLEGKMKKYIFHPTVQVKTMNYKVTILGEVARPGTYTIPDGQVTILSALGMAGDLTKYALRNDVLIVRNENGTISKQKVDLNSSDFINSPFYYLKQNDVVYVNSNKTIAKQSVLDPNTTIYISVASILVTILALVFRK